MDAEVINPTEKNLNIEWMPFSKLLQQRHTLYPLNETTIFKDSDYHSQILYSSDSRNEVNPTIYSEIFVERNINMGKFWDTMHPSNFFIVSKRGMLFINTLDRKSHFIFF